MKDKKVYLILLILVVVVLGGLFIFKNSKKKDKPKETTPQSTINVNDEAYKGKEIYVKDGDTIIEEGNGSQTIETDKTLEKTDLVEASPETKEKYEITGVKVTKFGAQTKITGTVKSNNSVKKDITVQAKFYSKENRVKGSASVRLNDVASKEIKNFEILIVGDLTKYDCKVNVEFTN